MAEQEEPHPLPPHAPTHLPEQLTTQTWLQLLLLQKLSSVNPAWHVLLHVPAAHVPEQVDKQLTIEQVFEQLEPHELEPLYKK